jgi:Lon protease-like protein
MLEKADDETLIHALCACLTLTPLEKQFLLESEDINQQSRRLLELIKMKDDNEKNEKEVKRQLFESEEDPGIL